MYAKFYLQTCTVGERGDMFSGQDYSKLFPVLITGSWNEDSVLPLYQTLLSEVCIVCENTLYSRWFRK